MGTSVNWPKIFEELDVEAAAHELQDKSEDEIKDVFLEYAFDTSDVRAYTLATELLRRETKWEWHYFASLVLCQPLCHLNGAYFAAFHHAKEAALLSPNDQSLKEYLLFFNGIPDKPMDDAVAKSVAKDLLDLDPASELAQRVIDS